MIIILPFLTRRNHRYYVLDNGELVPVEFEGGLYGGMIPHPNTMSPYGAPHPGQAGQGGMPNYPPPPQNSYYPNQPYPPQYQQPPPSQGYQSPYQQYQQPQQKP